MSTKVLANAQAFRLEPKIIRFHGYRCGVPVFQDIRKPAEIQRVNFCFGVEREGKKTSGK